MFQGMFLEQWYLYCSTVQLAGIVPNHLNLYWQLTKLASGYTVRLINLLGKPDRYSHVNAPTEQDLTSLVTAFHMHNLYVYVTSDLKMCNLILYLAWAWCDLMVQRDWRPIFLEHIHASKEPIHDTFMVSLMRMAWHGLRDAWMASGGS